MSAPSRGRFRMQVGACIHGTIWMILSIGSYLPANWARKAVLRMFKGRVGAGTVIYGGVHTRSPWRLRIGRDSVLGHYCHLDARAGLSIGDNVNISSEVNIWTQEHDMNSPGFEIVGDPVVVEDHAWLGNRSIILPGVRIGRGAVVCSGAVVTRDVPERAVVGGVPARIIGERTGELGYSAAGFGKLWFI